jgi:hypothetical protein
MIAAEVADSLAQAIEKLIDAKLEHRDKYPIAGHRRTVEAGRELLVREITQPVTDAVAEALALRKTYKAK